MYILCNVFDQFEIFNFMVNGFMRRLKRFWIRNVQAVVLGNIPKNLACVFFLIILRNFMKKFHQILHNYFQSELIEIYLLLGPNQKYSRWRGRCTINTQVRLRCPWNTCQEYTFNFWSHENLYFFLFWACFTPNVASFWRFSILLSRSVYTDKNT